MIPKCRTCAHDTCESYENACEDCAEYSAWKEARFVQEIRKEEREACAEICEEFANDYTKQLRAANECNHRDNAFKYAICIEAARVLAHKILGEQC